MLEDDAGALDALGERFMAALRAKEAGDLDTAEDGLRALVREEPRLPEPHLELARILLDTDRLEDAEAHAREGLQHLEASGPWTEELPDNVIQALAWGLLAEVLRRIADEDDVIFGDPARFKALVNESRKAFAKAASFDPSDEYASYHAFFLGVDQPPEPDDDVGDGTSDT